MECPECGLINPESAILCDCGYNFRTKVRHVPDISHADDASETPPAAGAGRQRWVLSPPKTLIGLTARFLVELVIILVFPLGLLVATILLGASVETVYQLLSLTSIIVVIICIGRVKRLSEWGRAIREERKRHRSSGPGGEERTTERH